MTEFITRSCKAESRYEVIIKTDSEGHYKATEGFARQLIDHAKPQTNADRIRAMSDEELATAIWAAFNDNDYLGKLFCDGKAGCLLECGDFDCDDNKEKDCVLRWLKQPAEVSVDGN